LEVREVRIELLPAMTAVPTPGRRVSYETCL